MQFRRYAVYDLGPGPLAGFGADWLGWDARTGRAGPATGGGWTDVPRRYGFHATIKAPFRLAEGRSQAGLISAFDAFAAELAPVTIDGGLRLAALGGFLALVFDPQPAAVTQMAAAVVRGLDDWRAPLTDADRARRRPESLSPAQRENLERWGYPHVMDQFRYHMTLTGPLDAAEADAARRALSPRLEGLLPRPHRIDTLVLMGEDAEGRFHALHRATLDAQADLPISL